MKLRTNLGKALKISAIVLFVGLVGIQFIPANRNQSNVIPETDFIRTFEPPDDVQSVLRNSCYDCHSNNTRYPWYNNLQPAAWFMEGHITDGKKELNFSEFGTYSKRRQKSKLRSVISQIKAEEMPLPSYTWIHWDAKLSDKEKELIENWVSEVREGL
ncbi:MAG: hypothetical protein DWQ47_11745 [Acidobacteria bacterium]|nr:MAG: hypothetical protein DWQ32_14160 [Acidobacteriota bacterium]REJ98246.1 MAG: hypothetical protein DWQ38_16960 [Acidobacteriota bacterium]REK16990.1 MAG: hypothetical protein DWQ43_02005 [Acidobacteriota bacterium]REK42900.1 MAG: hypothetical protein DWQ47_11745 [Acidobacteriota bacterium]